MAKINNIARKDLFDAIEGYYITSVLQLLVKKDCIDYTSGEIDTGAFGKKDPTALFRLLSDRSDVIVRSGDGRHRLAKKYLHYLRLGFHIDKLVSAYCHFDTSPDDKWLSPDPAAYSKAFEHAREYWEYEMHLDILQQLGANSILDLGSGYATMPMAFCAHEKGRTAIGIEKNDAIYRSALRNIKKQRLGSRVGLIHADAYDFEKHLYPEHIRRIDVVCACNYLNEYFQHDGKRLVSLLKKLRKVFKGKQLMVVDYYSVLGGPLAGSRDFQHNYLHDVVQLLSGQGVPPAGYRQWKVFYERAGCGLTNVYEGVSGGIRWFIHVIQL